jgi:hypothetical protein
VQEVVAERQVLLREHVGQALLVAVDHRGDRPHLRDRHRRGEIEVRKVPLKAVRRQVRVMGGKRGDDRRQHRHRGRVPRVALEDALHLHLDGRILPQLHPEFLPLRRIRQLAIDHKVRGLHEVAALGKLLDRDAPVPQDAVIAVQVRDAARARARVPVTLVVADVARVHPQLARVDRLFPLGAHHHGEGEFLFVQPD